MRDRPGRQLEAEGKGRTPSGDSDGGGGVVARTSRSTAAVIAGLQVTALGRLSSQAINPMGHARILALCYLCR